MPIRRTLAWGILGTGRAARSLAEAIKDSASGHLAAVAGRQIESARRFASEFEIPRAFGSYDDIVNSTEVEAVYIALPNHLHAEWTTRCATAGKHVLCEKPFAINQAEAESAIQAARRAKVFLMEALVYRCHPQTARLVEIVRNGDIGEVRLIQAGYSFNVVLEDEKIRTINSCGGGGIMDLGCFPMSMARLIAGASGGNPFLNPVDVLGAAHIGELSRVDQQATAAVKFPGGVVAALSCAIQVASESALRVWGSDGHIVVPSPWAPPQKHARLIVQRKGETSPTELLVDSPAPLFTHQVDIVATAIKRHDYEAPAPAMTWADTLGNMAALDAWRQSIGLTFDCERK